MTTVSVDAATISSGWRQAMRVFFESPGRRAFHTFVRIADPIPQVDTTWEGLDRWLADHELYSIETVANTIFPAQIAAGCRDHPHLVERYRRMYPLLRKRLPANRFGTYFGRLVAYPLGAGEFDQLGTVIDRIRREHAGSRPKQARYEAALQNPDDLVQDVAGTAIYKPGRDNNSIGFPCLSHCSFQLDPAGRVHLLAHYRSQYMVQRAYGNYVGLARLLAYVAERSGLAAGQLTVVAGLAQIEPPILGLRELLEEPA